LQQKSTFKKQLTAKQAVNILLPVSQHPFVFMLAIECYFLHKAKQNNQHNATENVSLPTSSRFWHFMQCVQLRKGKFPFSTAAEA
jgi:hypothetical protein